MSEQNLTKQVEYLRFTGKGGEYFRIWIVNLILTILTLGIYSAWAKVRTNRYFFANTHFHGSNFDYLATPMMIFKGRLIAIFMFIIYSIVSQISPVAGMGLAVLLILAMPWIIWRSMKFNARMTAYSNVRFSFHGSLGRVYFLVFLLPFLPFIVTAILLGSLYILGLAVQEFVTPAIAITLLASYLLGPYLQKSFAEFYLQGLRYGQGKFYPDLDVYEYYWINFELFLMFIGSLIFYAGLGFLVFNTLGFESIDLTVLQKDPYALAGSPIFSMLLGLSYLLMILFGSFLKAYYQVRIRRHVFKQTHFERQINFSTNIKIAHLTWIHISNFLLIVFTLGLAYPWAAIRKTRYVIDTCGGIVNEDISHYISQQQANQSALGEEVGEAFDIEADVVI